jgi:predicted alpha/beta superfamily hydrolase
MCKISGFIFLFFVQNFVFGQQDSFTTKPFYLGHSVTFQSVELNELRTLNIALPSGYSDTTNYPVVYVLDGSAHEDFIHIAGLVQFLTMYSLMPATIVVGIENVDRKRDFTFPTTVQADKETFPTTGGSELFIRFLEKEVLPFIAENYSTNEDKLLIGQSLGGLLATEILYKKPTLFTSYLIVSPSIWWNKQSLFEYQSPIFNTDFDAKIKVFIGVGHEHRIMVRDAKKLAKQLKKVNSLAVDFDYFPKEDHATVLHAAAYSGLRKLFLP